ncbi:type II toxin-antitoxin system VapC family toxin [Merismopedia glauca]|uniref:PIN domain nuclease n=1 Tax=Merismopedia glauca CCAP 1448/3 TaxID=1296344 RepID=A0A2T1C3D6_9CYAN|nr:type II toxin-antitoxin system VapC family toxin [Merismopedia glauca]PSB02785.1 PIN domain nuclease [Merismopedia glauca CCAP 1448/3]
MYLLDTNHCSRIILGDPNIIRHVAMVNESQIVTCVIVQGELTFMMENSKMKESNLSRLSEFLDDIRIYLADDLTATAYGQLKAALFQRFAPKEKEKRRRTTIVDLGFDDNDIWIAATALQYNLTIVSADRGFTRMQSVKAFPLENWCN